MGSHRVRHDWSNLAAAAAEEEKNQVYEKKFLRDYTWKFSQYGKGNTQWSPRGTKSSIEYKPKEKHAKAHSNQTNKG